jgi:hypothetical protein
MKLTKKAEGMIYLVAGAWLIFVTAITDFVGWRVIEIDDLFLIALGLFALWRVSRW